MGGRAVPLVGPPGQPIFSVGPSSGFYSPFWQIVYAEVPADTAPDALTSARQILDGGYPLTPSGGWTMPLVPDMTSPPTRPGDFRPVPPRGWLDGEPISFLELRTLDVRVGPGTNVVEEAPIYC